MPRAPRIPRPGRTPLGVALCVLVGVGMLAPEVALAGRYRTKKIEVADGLVLKKITDRKGPNRIRVLVINTNTDMTVDVALTKPTYSAYKKTSLAARDFGAIAAVNGDFAPGRPLHPFAQDADLYDSGHEKGWNFAVAANERAAYAGKARPAVDVHVVETGSDFRAERWNAGEPKKGEVAGYTRIGGAREYPPKDACSARIDDPTARRWTSGKEGIERTYVVEKVDCAADRMAAPTGNEVVLSARRSGSARDLVAGLESGESIRVTWSLGWPGVADSIGGRPMLVEDGEEVDRRCRNGIFCSRNPRTGVGATRGCFNGNTDECRVLYITVDGRQDSSVGMTPRQFAALFRKQGAWYALNMDGGASTTMVVDLPNDRKGNPVVVNRPSNGEERSISTVVLVHDGPDGGEPGVHGP